MTPRRPRNFVVIEVAPPKPGTRFNQWARAYGKGRLSLSLNVSPRQVYEWLNGRRRPRFETILAIQGISKAEPCGIGPLKAEDIIGSAEVISHSYREYSSPNVRAPRFVPIRRRA